MLQDPPPTGMTQDPAADSANVMSKRQRLSDSSMEEPESAAEGTGRKTNGFEELGLLGRAGSGFLARTISRESDGKLEGSEGQGESIGVSEGEMEKEELGFDLNFPASEAAKEGGSAQLGHKCSESRTIIDLEAENDCEEERAELGFGYRDNGDLGFGLGNGKGETFGEGVSALSKRRSSSREDKGKEKVADGDWLQLCTGSKLPDSGHNSGYKRSGSLSFGWK